MDELLHAMCSAIIEKWDESGIGPPLDSDEYINLYNLLDDFFEQP
jgi:hypothetical protein